MREKDKEAGSHHPGNVVPRPSGDQFPVSDKKTLAER